MNELLPVLVFAPLVAAGVAALTPERFAAWFTTATTALLTLLAVLVAVRVAADGPLRLALGDWPVPVGITMRVDGLAAVMLLLTGLVGTAVTIFATAARTLSRWFWPLWMFLYAGLAAVFVSGDLFNTYVSLELVTIGAVALVAIGGRDSIEPALRYLFVAVLGSLAFLIAVGLLYARTGTLDIASVGDVLAGGAGEHDGATALVALAIVTVAMALKTALFPLHGWLPPAHAGAPAAVSPLMSALVIKASFYVLVRVWVELGGVAGAQALAQLLGALGTAAVVWGSVLALRQRALKRVVAYSTVAQIGYFFLLFPLVTPALSHDAAPGLVDAAEHAWRGVLLLVLAHGVAKAAMFLTAGALVTGYGTDRLGALRGSGNRFPMLAFAFGASGVCLAGLPPTLAFAGKWDALWATLGTGQWWWLLALLGGTLLTLAYTARVLTIMLRVDVGGEQPAPIPARMRWSALVAAVVAAVGGLQAIGIADLLGVLS
ncbi:sodium:proton antiporter [Rhodococcus rhodnii]|uniref:Sodium:proton antiporter n=2 Tax=Rhodococcus rhodnii TaxID=38312 RepID=A0A6P2C9W8_9NOCA|nr:proton-conducting transporter membrane subunit [Rhodococcus rhodnii]EOM74317.1 putative multisubunit sodium/proton antiporter MnhD subunit [Rhodococcus rhodnii LMG 5362]TXG89549.1 sodium:proton antiporter [Rhodococcus rhodnii]